VFSLGRTSSPVGDIELNLESRDPHEWQIGLDDFITFLSDDFLDNCQEFGYSELTSRTFAHFLVARLNLAWPNEIPFPSVKPLPLYALSPSSFDTFNPQCSPFRQDSTKGDDLLNFPPHD
jgi:hypothetical protein